MTMNARRNTPAVLGGLAIYLLLVVAFPSTAVAETSGQSATTAYPSIEVGRVADGVVTPNSVLQSTRFENRAVPLRRLMMAVDPRGMQLVGGHAPFPFEVYVSVVANHGARAVEALAIFTALPDVVADCHHWQNYRKWSWWPTGYQ